MKNILQKFITLACLGILVVLMQAFAPIAGPELPIDFLYQKWIIARIDPTAMPTWAAMSETGKAANLRINQKMIDRKSFYEFEKAGKANILVYNPFNKGEFLNVPTTFTYSKENQYITLQEGEKTDKNGDTFRVPSMEYKIEKLTKKELVLIVVQNNYKLFFKAGK